MPNPRIFASRGVRLLDRVRTRGGSPPPARLRVLTQHTLALVVSVAACLGCNPQTPATSGKHDAHTEEGHHHEHAAPHGGTLLALGDHVGHFELVLDAEAGKLTAYAFDGEVEQSVRLDTNAILLALTLDDGSALTFALEPQASELTGETAGDTSEFSVTHTALKNCAHFTGTLGPLAFKGIEFSAVAFHFPDGNE